MAVPGAQLKVFAPIEALPLDLRGAVGEVIERGEALSRSEAVALERAWSSSGLRTGVPRGAAAAVQVRRVAGRTMACPLQLELRAGHAFAAFSAQVPAPVLDAVVPDARGRGELERLATGVPHVLDHPFYAPLAWFLAFLPSEQRFTHPPEGSGPRLVHLTTVGQAESRLERVIGVVESVLMDTDDVLVELADLALWLDAFDPGSLLELDHDGAGRLKGAAALKRDSTCAQLWRAVEALAEGDDHAAAVAYATARASWSHLRRLARAS